MKRPLPRAYGDNDPVHRLAQLGDQPSIDDRRFPAARWADKGDDRLVEYGRLQQFRVVFPTEKKSGVFLAKGVQVSVGGN